MVDPPEAATAFDRATALEPRDDGALAGTISDDWRAGRGPHGGYLAALILRGLTLTLDDAARAPRTLTVHYVSEPAPGPVRMETRLERRGRSLTTLSGRLLQQQRTIALAVAAFSVQWADLELDELAMPSVDPPWPGRRTVRAAGAPPFTQNIVQQPRFGRPFTGRTVPMVSGGWLGLAEPRAADALAITLFCDSWWPPPFVRLERFAPVPTIALTIYFRAPLPPPRVSAHDLCLARFETALVRDGCFEWDGVIWSSAGTVLAQSRQLALLLTAA